MAAYKILLPLDGSRLAEHSLVYLQALRAMGELNVLLLSVVDESEDFHALGPVEAQEREANVLSTYLREVGTDIDAHLGIHAEQKVVRGIPASCILEEAARFAPDLLLISTHGRSGVSRWRFGSVADKVIRAAPSNTFVIGPQAAELSQWMEFELTQPFGRILVPLDGSALAEQAIEVARSFAERYSSEVHFVRAVPMPLVGNGFGAEGYQPDMLDTMTDLAKTYISNVASRFDGPTPVQTDVIVGPAAFTLEDYIAEKSIDLVIMTSHGRGGLVRTALGSVTDRLLGRTAPVLIVRPKP
jgi:nucleotide-binding universal stress UspA family protein